MSLRRLVTAGLYGAVTGRGFDFTILLNSLLNDDPWNGASNAAISWRTMPSDHISDLKLYVSLLIISGERYDGDPTTVLALDLVFDKTRAIPKSPNFIIPFLVKKKLL